MPLNKSSLKLSLNNHSQHNIWVDLLLYPKITLPTTLTPVIIASALAWHNGVFSPVPVLLAFLVSWIIHVGGILVDNYHLITRHPNVREHPELNDALIDGTLKLPLLRLAIAACFLLPLLTGVYFLQIAGWPVVIIGAFGLIASFTYSAGPFQYGRTGLADPIFVLTFGVINVAATYYVSAAASMGTDPLTTFNAMPFAVFVIGLCGGLLVSNVLIVDDVCDRDFDKAKGWQTLVIRFGISTSRMEFALFTILAYLLPFFFYLGLGFSYWVLLPLLTLPFAINQIRAMYNSDKPEVLAQLKPKIILLALAHSTLLGFGIILS